VTPWENLADHWRSLAAEVQVYDTITDQLDVPCLVILPGSPWIEPNGFSIDTERYSAFAVTGSAAPSSAQRQMHQLLHFVRHHLPSGWAFESAAEPAQRKHQGATYLAAEARLTFSECTEGNPYETGASSP